MGEMPSSMSVPRLEASRTLPERAARSASVAMRPHAGSGTPLHAGRGAEHGARSPHPVEGIGALVSLAAVDGDLAADQEDEQRDRGPQDLLLRFAGGQEWTMCTQRRYNSAASRAGQRHRSGRQAHLERDLTVRLRHLRQHVQHGLDQSQEADVAYHASSLGDAWPVSRCAVADKYIYVEETDGGKRGTRPFGWCMLIRNRP